MAGDARERCLAYAEAAFRRELLRETPDTALLSIVLGALEAPLSRKDAEAWPEDLPEQVQRHADAFAAWLEASPAWLDGGAAGPAKVKAIADAVWSKLQKGFSKDVLHAQHVYNFAALLLPAGDPAAGGGKAARRQLDCASVVTTTYSACQALAASSGHADLRGCRMQISEDHCWLQLGHAAQRDSSVECTTDTASKRGLPVDSDAWQGWLYCGGRATLCSPRQAVAALVTSLDPTITKGKKGVDSEHLQEVQGRLLSMMLRDFPDALYPAALCALADLREVEEQDELDAALEAGDLESVLAVLERKEDGPRALFERAIEMAAQHDVGGEGQRPGPGAAAEAAGDQAEEDAGPAAAEGSAAGLCWYPYSYLAAYLSRRADFLAGRCPAAFPDAAEALQGHALAAVREALAWCGRGGGVLAQYTFRPQTDEELYKDIEGVLEGVLDGLKAHAKHAAARAAASGGAAAGGSMLEDASLLAPLLQLWDGICCLFAGKGKPPGWVGMLLRICALFAPAARVAAAEAVAATSGPMSKAKPLWAALKPAVLKPIFETADVAAGSTDRQASKRRRL